MRVINPGAALTAVIAVAGASLNSAAAQQLRLDEQAKRCYSSEATIDQKITGCTAVIASRGKPYNIERAYFFRGTAYMDKDQDDLAIQDFDQAIKLKPDLLGAVGNRGTAYVRKKQYDAAIKDFNQFIKLDRDNATGYFNRGIAHFHKALYDEAIRDFDDAIRLDRTKKQAIEMRDKAIKAKRDAEHPVPSNYDELKKWCFDKDADGQQTIQGCTAVIEGKRESAQDTAVAYFNRGLAHGWSEKYEQAVDNYSQAIKLVADSFEYWRQRCSAYDRLRKFDLAVADCTEAIRLKPDSAMPYVTRGLVHIGRDDLRSALADYDRAIELDAKYIIAWTGRCRARAIVDRLNEALSDCNQAAKLLGDTEKNSYWLATAGFLNLKIEDAAQARAHRYDWLFGIGRREPNYGVALSYFDKALALWAKDSWSLYGRGVTRRRSGAIGQGDADIVAAKAQNALIAEAMAAYGVRP